MQTIDAIITTTLDAAHAYSDGIAQARAHKSCKGKTPEELRPILLPIVAKYYAVPVIEGERKAKGTKVFDKDAKGYEAAKKALQRLIADIAGKTNADKEEIEVPAHIAKLAAQLAQACAEYEQARKLASTALANAFAK